MSKPIKRVLLTNDDGWRGPGLGVMEEIAAQIAEEVWVFSPDLDQSGVSMSISIHHPLRVHEFEERRFSVSGTPSDCVMLGVSELMPEPPDLVLSGVNNGANISDSVAYSGTIGGALTATLLNIPAIALSQATIGNIRQNLFWAFAYNTALIPVAAGVLYPSHGILLSPIFAAGAMALSSVFVLGNALRLRRFRAPLLQG